MSYINTPYTRTTLDLSTNYEKQQHGLSFEAHLAIHYAALVMGKLMALKVSQSAIVRRAVVFYAEYLGTLTAPQMTAEVHAVKAASSAMAGHWTRAPALERMQAVEVTRTASAQASAVALALASAVASPVVSVPFKEVMKGKDYSPPLDFEALDRAVEAAMPKTKRRVSVNKGSPA